MDCIWNGDRLVSRTLTLVFESRRPRVCSGSLPSTEGLAPGSVLQIHRILSRALKVAMQRGYVARNVATLVDAPSVGQDEIEPLTLDEALQVMSLAVEQRNGTRWSVPWLSGCGRARLLDSGGAMSIWRPGY